MKRRAQYYKTNRPDMAEGCHEKVDREFIGWVWNYPKRDKLNVEAKLKKFASRKRIIRLYSKRETEEFLAKIRAREEF